MDVQLSITQLIAGGFALVCVAAAAAWAIANAVSSERIRTLEGKVSRSGESSIAQSHNSSSSKQPDTIAKLSAQIEALEHEKRILASDLANLTRDSLAPESELGALLNQLSDEDRDKRIAASQGLIELNDPRAAKSIFDYYWKDRSEATERITFYEYGRKLLDWDKRLGADFIMRLLESDNQYAAEFAYEKLRAEADAEDYDEVWRPLLEIAALQSTDSLVRARAKLALHEREKVLALMPEAAAAQDGEKPAENRD